MCFRKRRAKRVRKLVDPYLTAVRDAYGKGEYPVSGEPVSHDTEVIIAAILASHEKLLDEQQKGLAALEKRVKKTIDDLRKLLSGQVDRHHHEQMNLLNQIQQNQRSG